MIKWYKTPEGISGAVAIILTTGLWICVGGMILEGSEAANKRAKIGYVVQERDLNGNELDKQFYEINGKKYSLKIDGKNLESTLNE